MASEEGVIKFRQEFRMGQPPSIDLAELDAWRMVFYRLGLIGQDRQKYGGAGYGNVSQRVGRDESRKRRRFVITGTQTGGLPELGPEHYTTVINYDYETNAVVVEGPLEASSESMTHGMVYDQSGLIRYVFHAHSPEIWKAAGKLGLPETREDVEYGTPQMAEEVRRIFVEADLDKIRIFSMAGHEDGIVSFGRTAQEAGSVMVEHLVRALAVSKKIV